MSSPADLDRLAAFASALKAGDVPARALTTARACLLYGLAMGIGARHLPVCTLALAGRSHDGEGCGPATRFVDGGRVVPGDAAFANAVMMAARIQGEAHVCGHVGGVIIPAALAVAERGRVSGALLLAAIIAGYEVALRIGRDHAADLSNRGLRTTPCYGVFGAAAAVSRLMEVGPPQMASAIALAANLAGGLREFVEAGTEESPFQSGFAARNGIHAGTLAAAGVVAAPSSLHGKAGFFKAYGNAGVDYGTRLVAQLGVEYELTNMTFRAYPANQFFRGIIRGLAILRQQAGDVEPQCIELHMNPFEADFIGARYAGPYTSATQTVVSAPFCAALAWATGTVTFKALRIFDDEKISGLIAKVKVVADPARARYEPALKVELVNGRTLAWRDETGSAGYRLTWEAATSMTCQVLDEVNVPRPCAQRLIEQAADLENLADVGPLISAVCAASLAG